MCLAFTTPPCVVRNCPYCRVDEEGRCTAGRVEGVNGVPPVKQTISPRSKSPSDTSRMGPWFRTERMILLMPGEPLLILCKLGATVRFPAIRAEDDEGHSLEEQPVKSGHSLHPSNDPKMLSLCRF